MLLTDGNLHIAECPGHDDQRNAQEGSYLEEIVEHLPA